jgi:hypothetical protein
MKHTWNSDAAFILQQSGTFIMLTPILLFAARPPLFKLARQAMYV